jgi:ubiquinone/menaquinone biosynthesis C-methylase UbiE
MSATQKIEFGDFQTPLPLAQEVCRLLTRQKLDPDVILEPTCGIGAFLLAAREAFPRASLCGWDINPDYVAQTRLELNRATTSNEATVLQQDSLTTTGRRS